jgi:GT2 family glycosyltransferase
VTGPAATVVIVSKNRKDDLRSAVQSALAQAAAPEVIVIDDGSSDGTAAMIREEFPSVRLVRHEESRGYIARRNEGNTMAAAPIVFSIDDDAVFSTPAVVGQTIRDFEHDRIGAVAIPYIDINTDPGIKQRAPDASAAFATGRYIGTAHAVRRDVFRKVGGYREDLTHQGEEGDFCIRMLDAGYFVRLGTADPIHHFESPKRDRSRMDYFGVRNAIRFAWQNVPQPFVLYHLPIVAVRCAALTLNPPRLRTRLSGIIDGLRACRSTVRQPVRRATYRLWRTLEGAPQRLDGLT